MDKNWGFIRETADEAKTAGKDPDTGVFRTGLDEYLSVIYPDIHDWIHDTPMGNIDGKYCRKRPDYRSESAKIIVEFDGVQHYQSPYNIRKDHDNTEFYKNHGYTVIRIPYFIQLSTAAVKTLFGVDVNEQLFDESIPSLGPKGRSAPAFLCNAGIKRMAEDFRRFPEQYAVNMNYMKIQPKEEQYLLEWELLEAEYNRK